MSSVRPTSLFLSVFLAAAAAPPAGAAEKTAARIDHAKELAAFLAEMDRGYVFFDLKGIRQGWGPFKAGLEKRVKACRSDAELLGLVGEAIAYLRDAHMGIVKTSVKLDPPPPEWCLPVSFMPATGNRVIVMTAPGALEKRLPPGTVVAKIDGKDARAVLDAKAKEAWERGGPFSSPQRARIFEYRIPLRGKKGEKHVLTVLSGKKTAKVPVACDAEARGWPHTYNMPEGLTAVGRSCRHGKLPGGSGYIHLRGVDPDVEKGIAAALEAHPDAKGWIIDIRGNGGGGYGQELQARMASIPKPVACIIDAGCMSAGETFARDIVAATGARLFGSTTAGASSAKRTWDFPSGIATIVLATRSRFGIKGKPIEFNGIAPDEEVEAVPEEVAAGKNSEILRAEEFLLGGKEKAGAATKKGKGR